jgi:hypothetical protein
MAGESAGDYAQRLREKAARLERSAALWERGAVGEATTAEALKQLTDRGWTTFHDVRWPGRQRANIDHIAVGPSGVFVIDSKNWSGVVHVVEGVLTRDGRRCEREVAAAVESAQAVAGLLQGFGTVPVLCFTSSEPLSSWSGDVMLCSSSNISDLLLSMPPMLGPQSIERTLTLLKAGLTPAAPAAARGAPRSVRAATPRPGPRRRRRAGGRGSLRRTKVTTLLQGLVVAALMASGAVWALPKLAAHTPEVLGLSPVHADFGQSVGLQGSSKRPTLQLSASAPVGLRAARARPALEPGKRLVAVHVHIVNASARTWTSPRLVLRARDTAGDLLSPIGLRPIKRGPLLPAVARLTPAGIADGYVAFALPRHERLTDFSLTLGPSSYETIRWSSP